ACGVVAAILRSLFGALVKGIERGDEFLTLRQWKSLVETLFAPWRAGLVDLEIQLPGDLDKGVFVRGMQPAAAEVKHDAGRGLDRVRASADTVARFQHDGA